MAKPVKAGEAYTLSGPLAKVHPAASRDLGLVFGWGMVCNVRGQDGVMRKYFDLQRHHIPDEAMLRNGLEFASGLRVSGEMHLTDQDGESVEKGFYPYLFPMTEQIAKGYGMTITQSGLMVCSKPTPDVLERFDSGEYTGFSIGGTFSRDALIDVEIDEDEAVFS